MNPLPLILASASPRRRALLEAAGIIFDPRPADLDDAALAPRGTSPTSPALWTIAMAWFKAARVAASHADVKAWPGWLLGADTVCDLDGRIIGKPADQVACREVLRAFAGRSHRVHTGVALHQPTTGRRILFVESAEVELGSLDERSIDRYVDEGLWRGKAGGYNYEERVAAGWPLRCLGEPTTVMGLPMPRLLRELAALRLKEAA